MLDHGKLVGIVTSYDFLELVAGLEEGQGASEMEMFTLGAAIPGADEISPMRGAIEGRGLGVRASG